MRFLSVIFLVGMAACAQAPVMTPVNVDPHLPARTAIRNLVEVVQAVEPVAEALCVQRAPTLNCDFLIVVDETRGAPPNAFQTQDDTGRPVVAFTVPLIAEARNRDELAFIMSHEVAHHILGHLARQNESALAGAQLFGGLASVFSGGSEDSIRRGAEFGAELGARTYSKNFELEADAMGALIAHQAGFDARKGAEFFLRIPDPGHKFLGSHPANADRLITVQRVVARLPVR